MSKIVTTRQQYARLLELLLEKPEVAQGFSKCPKEEVTAFWQNVAKELNSLGPPIKEVATWKKVWLDWKAYTKRKLAENKREQTATGGGRNRQHIFNEMEEEIIKLTALKTSTFGIADTVSAGLPGAVENNTIETDADEPMVFDNFNVSRSRSAANPRKRAETNTLEILKEQLEAQKKFYEESVKHFEEQRHKVGKIASSMRRLCRTKEKSYDLHKEQIEETRRHNKVLEDLIAEKNKIKQKMLSIEEKGHMYSTK